MNKLSLILLLSLSLIVLFSLSVQANSGFNVTLDPEVRLVNTSIKATQSIMYGVRVSGNASGSYVCQLHTTENSTSGPGDFVNVETTNSITNATNYNFTLRTNVAETDVVINNYTWAVNCTSSEGRHSWSNFSAGTNYTFGVDVTAPSVTVNSPATQAARFNANNTIVLNLTVIDANPGSCVLDTSINYSSFVGDNQGVYNYSSWNRGWENATYLNNTRFNFTKVNQSGGYNFTQNNGGDFSWFYYCNDTAGNIARASSNLTFYVDIDAPGLFEFDVTNFSTGYIQLWNSSRATDYTPQFGWNASYESNFSRYEIFWYNDSLVRAVAGGFIAQNVTNRTLVTVNLTNNLGADTKYFLNVTAFDLAGNKRQITTVGVDYTTWSRNRQLKAGWNALGNIGNNVSLSLLLNASGATTASIWNSTHQFQSHVSGGSNGGVVVKPRDPFLIYLSNDSTFDHLIHNVSGVLTFQSPVTGSDRYSVNSVNLTNQTASDWNLIVNLNDTESFRLNQLDNFTHLCRPYANCDFKNISAFVYFNTSLSAGSKHVPYVSNWTFNNRTKIGFGDAVWAFVNDDNSNNVVIDWGNLSNY